MTTLSTTPPAPLAPYGDYPTLRFGAWREVYLSTVKRNVWASEVVIHADPCDWNAGNVYHVDGAWFVDCVGGCGTFDTVGAASAAIIAAEIEEHPYLSEKSTHRAA